MKDQQKIEQIKQLRLLQPELFQNPLLAIGLSVNSGKEKVKKW